MPLFPLAAGAGGPSLTAHRFQKLTFAAVPAAMEFAVEIGSGTLVFRGDADAPTLQALLESCDGLAGYSVQIAGSTQQTGTGADGMPLYSGSYIVILTGPAPYPAWGTVQNSEVQVLTVEDGSTGDYTLNSGAAFQLSANQAVLQANQRALGGVYAEVVTKGALQLYNTGPDVTSPADGQGDATDDNDATYWAWGNAIDNYADFDLGEAQTLIGITLTISPFTAGDSGPDELRIYGSDTPFSGGGAGGGTLVKSFSGLSPWDFPLQKQGPLLFDAPVSYRYFRYFASWQASSVTFNTHEIEFLAVAPGSAYLRSYFPFATGAIPAPATTGTGAAAHTLFHHATSATLVTSTAPTLETLLLATLETPAASSEATSYTPGNPAHWDGALPATVPEAVNRVAYAFNEMFWDQIS